MTEFVRVPLPQFGANDVSAQILEWLVPEGAQVRAGEALCSVETTKSVSDVEAPAAGYVVTLVEAGASADTGQTLAVVASVPASREDVARWLAEQEAQAAAAQPVTATTGPKWTYKAELLARQQGVDIAAVPASGERVTEADVRAYLAGRSAAPALAHDAPHATSDARDLMDDRYPTGRVRRLLLIGGGNGAIQVLDALAKIPSQRAVAIMDDNPALAGKSAGGVPVVGGIDLDRAATMHREGDFDAAVISVSTSIPFRQRIYDEWQARGIPFANVIHPSAVIGANVTLGQGNLILAFCNISACATLGDNNFISPYCSIEHHCVLGSHCSFGPAVITSGEVHIGDRVRFGTGIFIEPHVTIGQDAVIGSGCALWSNVPAQAIVKTKPNYVIRRREAGA